MTTRLAPRVLLIGWDAADWQMIDPLLEQGHMPNLERFIDEGARGNVATLFPVLSPILWNSIATGKRADKHDILGFIEPDGRGGIRPVTSTSRKSKALWNILSQQDLRSCIVGWYASHPAEHIRGCVITDRYQHASGNIAAKFPLDEHAVHPPELLDVLAEMRVTVNDITPEQVLPFIPEAHRIRQPDDPRLPLFCQTLAECATVHNAATHLLEHEDWDFAAVYYDAIDHFGHGFMEYHPPRMTHVSEEDFELYRHVMNGCYRYHDMMLGRLLELAGPDTTVIILSDHGFLNDDLRPELRYTTTEPRRKTGPGVNPVAWHRRFGVIAAHGPGIKPGIEVHGASLLDVAPTVLALLGQPVPDDMDGQALTQIFTKDITPAHIDTFEPPHEHDGVFRGEHHEDPFAAQEVLRQLIDLGYIEQPGDDQTRAVERCLRDRAHNLAQVHFAAGEIDKAYDIMRGLLDDVTGEDDQSAHHLRCRLAMCLIAMGRLDEVEPLLAPVLSAAPDLPLAGMLYGQLQYARGNHLDALHRLTKVQQSNPRLPFLHGYLGRVHLELQQWELAEKAFRRALDIDGDDPEAHDGLGIALRHQGRIEDAVYHHMRSAALEHHRAETHLNLGLALAQTNQTDWAIRAFEVAAELAPRHPLPHRCLADLYERAKHDAERAQQHRDKAEALRSDAR